MSSKVINAYAVKHKGGRAEPFTYEKHVRDNDVLVRITHCSVARGDVQSMDDDWGDTKFPLVAGHEMVGVIEEVGPAVAGLNVGDRVGVGYQQAACFSCEFCRGGNEHLCPEQKVIGVDCYGGMAEHLAVDHRFAFRLPPTLGSASSAPLLSSGVTVYSAIVRAGLADRSKVAVLGVGGLGQIAIKFLYKMGHEVFAFTHSSGKKAIIEHLGASYVDSSKIGNSYGQNRCFDFILSTVNVTFDLNAYLRMLRSQGKFCFVAQSLEPHQVSAGLLYDNAQRAIYGNYVGSRANTAAMLAFAADHDIASAVHILPFEQVNEAIDLVRSNSVSKKVILQC